LEPGLVLRIARCRGKLEVEVRAARVAGVADEAHRLPGRELHTCEDGRLEVGEVAVRPREAVGRADREADAAVPLRQGPRLLDRAVGERVELGALGRGDVGGRVVVVGVPHTDDTCTARDREDVAIRVARCAEQ